MRYQLKAIGPGGGVESIDSQAPDETTAVRQLEGRGYTVLSVRAKHTLGAPWGARSRRFPVALFSQELRVLINAGLPLVEAIDTLGPAERASLIGVLFQQGALSALTNPKALLFFTAFLPQFIDPARSLFVQFVIMAGTFAAIEIATEVFIASMAHRISPWLRRVGRRFNQVCGGVFMAIGVALPLRS